MQGMFQPVPDWTNLKEYADAYKIQRLTLIYPSLLLAITYLIMLSCIHRLIPENKKIWSTVALAIGIVYSVMASINYNIQAVAIRQSLASGEIGGIELFIPDNPHSVYAALANSYVYMSISMFFASFIFDQKIFGSPTKTKWIRVLLGIQIISAIGQTFYSMIGIPDIIFILTSMTWVLGAPAAFILIATWFKTTTSPSPLPGSFSQ
jgi:hypothetical protein